PRSPPFVLLFPYTTLFRSVLPYPVQVRGFLGRSGTGATWVTTERNRKMRTAVEELAVGDRVRIPFCEQGVKSFEEFTVTSAPVQGTVGSYTVETENGLYSSSRRAGQDVEVVPVPSTPARDEFIAALDKGHPAYRAMEITRMWHGEKAAELVDAWWFETGYFERTGAEKG